FLPGHERSTITYEIPGFYLFDTHNLTFPGDDPAKRVGFGLSLVQETDKCFRAGPQPVLHNTYTHHIHTCFRIDHSRGRACRMAYFRVKSFPAEQAAYLFINPYLFCNPVMIGYTFRSCVMCA